MARGDSGGSERERERGDKRKRSPRHVKAAARILQKEARKILKRHRRRLAPDPAEAIAACVAAIDTHRVKEDMPGLEEEAEKLDELLHQHASFARKSALRETLENIGIAVLIALGLRACFYEPFKIPSGSMMPTLRKGDHIFVNKFAYGVQIPFTSTVVGQSLGDIDHGDVVVFRFPLDPSEDFIKRVVGLPGDEVRVAGREVAVRHAGEEEFTVLAREPVDDKCYDEDGKHEVAGCELFAETHGDATYVVRYSIAPLEERDDLVPKARVWKVPEGHLLVMGDNRNQSHDSLQWTVRVEAVDADKILGEKDLRDLTSEKLFTAMRSDELGELSDPSHDRVTWMSTHRSRAHDIELAIWRDPPLGARAMFEALSARVEGGQETTVADMVSGKEGPTGDELDRTLQVGATLDGVVVGRDDDGWHVVTWLEPAQAVLELHCGRKVCKNSGRLAARLTEVVARFERDREQATRELLVRPRNIRYGTHWTGRSDVRDHYYERALHPEGEADARATVRLQVFRKPKQNVDVLQDAALRSVNASASEATPVADLGERAWMVEGEEAFTFVATDDVRDMLVVLSCGRAKCKTIADATALATTVWERVPKAASDRRKMKKMLLPEDLSSSRPEGDGWVDGEVVQPERNPFDRVRFEATVQGSDHSAEVEAWHDPPEGLAAKIAALRTEYGMAPDDSIGPGGGFVEEEDGYHFAFGVDGSNTVIRIRCRTGLCPAEEDAVKLARRAAEKAENASTFIDPKAERPQPFVPRGNVKGRAERIWLPLSRFWKKIE